VANHAHKYFGQPFVVVNKAGAAGTIASQFVASVKPDGYTLLTGGGSETTTAGHFRKLPFHPIGDFEPVINVVRQQINLNVRADSPWKSIQEFLADAKKKSGEIFLCLFRSGQPIPCRGYCLGNENGRKVAPRSF